MKWISSYVAKGVSDAEAHQVIDGAMYRALCIRSPLLCTDDQRTDTPAEKVSFESKSISSTPLNFRGYLRRPEVLLRLHGCDGSPETLDQNRGIRIATWGYVALTVDRFDPRGIKNACAGGHTADMAFEAYRALNFLVTQQFVDPKRVVALGFSQGGLLNLSSVERGPVEQAPVNKFLAAAAFYPPCWHKRVSTLILTGESDD